MAAVSARRMRGPSVAAHNKGAATAARQAPPARNRPRDRPAAPAGHARRPEAAGRVARVPRPATSASGPAASRPAGRQGAAAAAERGTRQPLALLGRLDGDGGQAVGLIRRALVRSVRTGSSAAAPSSVAFCTTRSVASRFSGANGEPEIGLRRLRPQLRARPRGCARSRRSVAIRALPIRRRGR